MNLYFPFTEHKHNIPIVELNNDDSAIGVFLSSLQEFHNQSLHSVLLLLLLF